MIKDEILKLLQTALKKLNISKAEIDLQHPANPNHGDFATSIALQQAKSLKKSPLELAQEITKNIPQNDLVEKVEVVKPGFINFHISIHTLIEEMNKVVKEKDNYGRSDNLKNKKIMIEFTDPNPFKEFHIGHLYSNIVGEALSRLFESQGAVLRRANYQGDVGLHVAKAIWGMQQKMKQKKLTLEQLKKTSLEDRVSFMGESYALGTTSYETDKQAKSEITNLNKKIYDLDSSIKEIYEMGRKWSLDYFEKIYARLGTKFDFYYFERNVGEKGLEIVKQFLNKNIFSQSKGAIIFSGEKYGLHTRVFINSQGLPTYEAKDLGLALIKYKDFAYDSSLIITGAEVKEYFKVVLKALEKIDPQLYKKTRHLTHGMVRVPEGKMSSRTGNILTGVWLLDEARKKILEKAKDQTIAEKVGIGSIKYALLKNSIGKDIEFQFEESISFEGNSGPYLQYTYVRCKSILEKVTSYKLQVTNLELNLEEKALLRLLQRFPEVVGEACQKFAPNLISNYLFGLAQVFNLFYQKHPVLKADQKTKQFRLILTQAVGQVIKNGLYLLGIETVNRM